MVQIDMPQHVHKFAKDFLRYLSGPNTYVTEDYWNTKVFPEQHECYLNIKDQIPELLQSVQQKPDENTIDKLFLTVSLFKLNQIKDLPVHLESKMAILYFDGGVSGYENYSKNENKSIDEVITDIQDAIKL